MIFGSKILVINHYNKYRKKIRNAAEFPAEFVNLFSVETNIHKFSEYRYKLR